MVLSRAETRVIRKLRNAAEGRAAAPRSSMGAVVAMIVQN